MTIIKVRRGINGFRYRDNTIGGGKAVILVGEKSNGKSTFIFMLQSMLGDSNVSNLDFKDLDSKFSTVMLFGKLANLGDDISDSYKEDVATFKKIVTGEPVKAEEKGKPPFNFRPYVKLIFSANNIPRMNDSTGAALRRLLIIPLNAHFNEADSGYDPQIRYKLAETEAVQYFIRLSIQGLQRVLKRKKFTIPSKVQQEKEAYTLAHEGYGPLSLRCCLATPTITDEALSFILFYSSVQYVLYSYRKSGKSIQGRTEFQTMLDEIKDGALGVSYVIVFKLSRFGRNAKDILNSLELIMQYGVHLLCVEDGLDSSNAMGKLMITILGAVAEMERENIIAQSYLGREEKARSGGWNGGMAPYGYQLDKEQGKLVVVEGQKEIVQLIYNKFIYENMSYTAISAYLNRNGYKREPAKNATKPSYGEWSTEQIKRILANPLYTGHIAYGRRRTEKVEGTENSYHFIKQREFIRSEKASHEAIISEEDFARAQEIKAMRATKGNHNIGQAKAHLLSGIARCPQCGAPMYISTTRWVNEDGTKRQTESYVCSYAMKHHGTSVCKRNGIVAEVLEKEVMEFTGKLLRNPKFVTDIEEKIQSKMDFSAVENSIENTKKRLQKLAKRRSTLEHEIDCIDEEDIYSARRRADMAKRLDNLYTEIYKTEDYLEDEKKKLEVLKDEKMNIQTIYSLLWSFDKIYDRMTREERRSLVKYLIAEVETNTAEDRKKLGRCCKSITYRLPIEKPVLTEFANSGVRVETAALLERA